MRNVVVVLDNIRSAHNVGSILRSADGFGISEIIMCGISPYPSGSETDSRLPHIAKKADSMIFKTALGAEKTVNWRYEDSTQEAINILKKTHSIICLEQTPNSLTFTEIKQKYSDKEIALIVGPEVSGLSDDILQLADDTVEIPMRGKKESLNVAVATAVAMYELTKA